MAYISRWIWLSIRWSISLSVLKRLCFNLFAQFKSSTDFVWLFVYFIFIAFFYASSRIYAIKNEKKKQKKKIIRYKKNESRILQPFLTFAFTYMNTYTLSKISDTHTHNVRRAKAQNIKSQRYILWFYSIFFFFTMTRNAFIAA